MSAWSLKTNKQTTKRQAKTKLKMFLYAIFERLDPQAYVKGSLAEFCYGGLFDIKLVFLNLFGWKNHYHFVSMRTQESLKQIKPN